MCYELSLKDIEKTLREADAEFRKTHHIPVIYASDKFWEEFDRMYLEYINNIYNVE